MLVYRKAVAAADGGSAILRRLVFGKDLELRDQLSRSSGRVAPLIAEGFGQYRPSDGRLPCAGSRFRSRVQRPFAKALGKEFISEKECRVVGGKVTEISKMLTPWINYLQRCNWKSRGVGPDGLPEPESPSLADDETVD